MLAPGAPKDNANPTIHAVEEDYQLKKHPPLGWSQLDSLHAIFQEEETKDDLPFSQSHADRAVVHALLDTLEASQGEGVALLRKAGVALPPYDISGNSATLHRPSVPRFVPYSYITQSNKEREQALKDSRGQRDSITSDEIFTIIRSIQDPEHPGVTLEQLRVVSRGQIVVEEGNMPTGDSLDYANFSETPNWKLPSVTVRFTPTIPHCSMATLIGLSIRVKLMRSLPKRFKLKVFIEPGTHNSEDAVNKQLADKERVAAALENSHLLGIVNKCIREGMQL